MPKRDVDIIKKPVPPWQFQAALLTASPAALVGLRSCHIITGRNLRRSGLETCDSGRSVRTWSSIVASELLLRVALPFGSTWLFSRR